MTTEQFNKFFKDLDKDEFAKYWRIHSGADTAKYYNLRDNREANKIAKLLNLTRTTEELVIVKSNMIEKCRLASTGQNNPMYGKSAMLGKHHSENSKTQMSNTHLSKSDAEKLDIKLKRENTNLIKFGTKYPAQNDQIKTKCEQYFLAIYGVKNPFQAESVKELIKLTNLTRYGVENPSQNEIIKNKKFETMYNHFNSYHVSYRYLYNNIKFDSSWELMYYIYLSDLNIPFEYKPKIKFEYYINNKLHYYCPDFKIDNNYIEIKGNQFFDLNGNLYNPYSKDQEKTIAKSDCMKANNIIILRYNNLIQCFNYIDQIYGKNYCEQFRIK